MIDENETPEESETDTEDQSPKAGQRLAEARRERQISVLEIAKELHLDETKVRALENNEFEILGAPVFAKGHLRKYAHLVDVDESDVLADYYGMTRSQSIPPVIADRQRPARELSPGPWIAVVVVIAGAMLAYWLLTRQPPPPVQATAPPVSENAAVAEAESIGAVAGESDTGNGLAEPAPGPTVDVEPEPSAISDTEPPAATEPEPFVAAAGEAPSEEGVVRLTIVFLGDCWTEIFDATGRRLFYNMGSAGQSVDVAGPGPLSVLFGDADNVSLTVNGEDFTIADADRSGRTARFALFGP